MTVTTAAGHPASSIALNMSAAWLGTTGGCVRSSGGREFLVKAMLAAVRQIVHCPLSHQKLRDKKYANIFKICINMHDIIQYAVSRNMHKYANICRNMDFLRIFWKF
jgi:hypothetical protein